MRVSCSLVLVAVFIASLSEGAPLDIVDVDTSSTELPDVHQIFKGLHGVGRLTHNLFGRGVLPLNPTHLLNGDLIQSGLVGRLGHHVVPLAGQASAPLRGLVPVNHLTNRVTPIAAQATAPINGLGLDSVNTAAPLADVLSKRNLGGFTSPLGGLGGVTNAIPFNFFSGLPFVSALPKLTQVPGAVPVQNAAYSLGGQYLQGLDGISSLQKRGFGNMFSPLQGISHFAPGLPGVGSGSGFPGMSSLSGLPGVSSLGSGSGLPGMSTLSGLPGVNSLSGGSGSPFAGGMPNPMALTSGVTDLPQTALSSFSRSSGIFQRELSTPLNSVANLAETVPGVDSLPDLPVDESLDTLKHAKDVVPGSLPALDDVTHMSSLPSVPLPEVTQLSALPAVQLPQVPEIHSLPTLPLPTTTPTLQPELSSLPTVVLPGSIPNVPIPHTPVGAVVSRTGLGAAVKPLSVVSGLTGALPAKLPLGILGL